VGGRGVGSGRECLVRLPTRRPGSGARSGQGFSRNSIRAVLHPLANVAGAHGAFWPQADNLGPYGPWGAKVKRLKVLTVIGTRPEAIKMAPVIKELAKYPDEITSVVCATAQHREMLNQVLDVFDIQPDYDLNVMLAGQTLAQLTANILTRLDQVVAQEQPDWVLVQGDTTTVMVASLVAYYHRVRVGHVEAGLRTGDKWQPYPEEINRRITDLLADCYFAPTESNRQNLLREGIPASTIAITGNTVVDALLMTISKIRQETGHSRQWSDNGQRLILVTAHRRENFGQPLIHICRAIAEIAARYPAQIRLVYPVHPNPNVTGPVHEMLAHVPNVTLTEPLDYYDFVRLMSEAHLILTDSGGLQEEAPSLRVPVLVLREVTERPEGVATGVVKLIGTDEQAIVSEVTTLLEDPQAYQAMATGINPYGDGCASQRIVEALRAISPGH
jgi:UDP-N-acetylglucosamine 2-epimerase (non-hydrolysing)